MALVTATATVRRGPTPSGSVPRMPHDTPSEDAVATVDGDADGTVAVTAAAAGALAAAAADAAEVLGEALLVSFDIDGTMVFGDPPGGITVEMVLDVQARGAIIGSASDRTMSDQAELWKRHGVVVDFVGHKHRLDEVRAQFHATRWIHIGDTQVDEHYARLHDFEFHHIDRLPEIGAPGWIW